MSGVWQFSKCHLLIALPPDLRHNTDIRRLKGVTQKDLDRMTKYHIFYTELITVLHNYGIDNGYGRRSDD